MKRGTIPLFYNIILYDVKKEHEYSELIKEFFTPDQFSLYSLEGRCNTVLSDSEFKEKISGISNAIEFRLYGDNKNRLKGEIYDKLSCLTGIYPPWGIITGIRPVKLTGEIVKRVGTVEAAKEELISTFRVSKEKTEKALDIYSFQQEKLGAPPTDSVGIYIGIPFCPTRCLYCSFASNQVDKSDIDSYIIALKKEIAFVGSSMKSNGLSPESIYIGGGTPTALNSDQLEDILSQVADSIDLSKLREYTVEAGRPDTITSQKLDVIRKYGVERISVNPQTLNDNTLELIGRRHSSKDFLEAFELVQGKGFSVVNCDMITCLPGEDTEDIRNTTSQLVDLRPQNITVHMLAVKKASKLIEIDKDFHYKQINSAEQMLCASADILNDAGYRPYYLYRQKHMAGCLENTGYCRDDAFSIYNIRIMEENQTIIAMGAGGISKLYFPNENRLERIPNVTNYEVYIERIDEMIERKKIIYS